MKRIPFHSRNEQMIVKTKLNLNKVFPVFFFFFFFYSDGAHAQLYIYWHEQTVEHRIVDRDNAAMRSVMNRSYLIDERVFSTKLMVSKENWKSLDSNLLILAFRLHFARKFCIFDV